MGDPRSKNTLNKELLDKYLSIKRSRRRRKRVPANVWITVEKLPEGYQKRRKPPKIDDDDELESALSSIKVINCSSNDLSDSKVTSRLQESITTEGTNSPLLLDDFDVADIDDNLLLDCLLSNLDDLPNFITESVDLDSIGFEQSQQLHLTDSQQLDFLNELFKEHSDFNFIQATNQQEFGNIQLNHFPLEPPQESILSSTSPFPSTMSSPSIPSTSPHQQLQPNQSDNQKVSDFSASPRPRPPPSSTFKRSPPPSTVYPPSSLLPQTHTAPLPPQPSYEYKKSINFIKKILHLYKENA